MTIPFATPHGFITGAIVLRHAVKPTATKTAGKGLRRTWEGIVALQLFLFFVGFRLSPSLVGWALGLAVLLYLPLIVVGLMIFRLRRPVIAAENVDPSVAALGPRLRSIFASAGIMVAFGFGVLIFYGGPFGGLISAFLAFSAIVLVSYVMWLDIHAQENAVRQ